MASQLTEFHYHLTQGGRAGLFDFEEPSFDIKNIYNYYLRKVSTPLPLLRGWIRHALAWGKSYQQLPILLNLFALITDVYSTNAAVLVLLSTHGSHPSYPSGPRASRTMSACMWRPRCSQTSPRDYTTSRRPSEHWDPWINRHII